MRLGRAILAGLIGGLLAALALGCAPFGAGTLERWPARDALYRRHCAMEVRQGRIPFNEFDACVHRLDVHRGEACTGHR